MGGGGFDFDPSDEFFGGTISIHGINETSSLNVSGNCFSFAFGCTLDGVNTIDGQRYPYPQVKLVLDSFLVLGADDLPGDGELDAIVTGTDLNGNTIVTETATGTVTVTSDFCSGAGRLRICEGTFTINTPEPGTLPLTLAALGVLWRSRKRPPRSPSKLSAAETQLL